MTAEEQSEELSDSYPCWINIDSHGGNFSYEKAYEKAANKS